MVLPLHPNANAPVLSHFSLEGKTAIVTGGSKGIGLEVARGLSEAGAAVAFTYSSTPKAEADAIAAAISQANAGRPVKAYQCDVRSRESVEATIDQAVADLGGKLDVLVSNSGIAGIHPAEEYPADQFKDIFEVNLFGSQWAAAKAARIFKAQKAAGSDGRGSIVYTASVSGTLVNIPQTQAAYNSSKAALVHLAKSQAVEWADFARVNSISPGFIDTEMIKIHPPHYPQTWMSMIAGKRFCKAEELKGAYVFAASSASSYMTGCDIIIDGGYTLV